MATPSLLENLGIGAYNKLYEATGGVVPGSIEDKRRKLEQLDLDRQLREAGKGGNTPAGFANSIKQASAAQNLNLGGQKLSNDLALQYLGAASLLDAAKAKSGIKLNELSAETANEINKLAAANQQRLALLAPVQQVERDMRGADSGDLEKVLAYYSGENQANRDLQMEMSKPRFGNIAPLLAGLGVAAASLFG